MNINVCISNIVHTASLNVINEFSKKGAKIFAKLSDKVDLKTVNIVENDDRLKENVISNPGLISDISSFEKMAYVNTARLLGLAGVKSGATADLGKLFSNH